MNSPYFARERGFRRQGIPLVFLRHAHFKKTRLKSLILRLNKAKDLKSYRLKLFVWHA